MSDDAPMLTREAMGITPGLPLEVGDGPDGLRSAVQRLLDIESIKQLKHAYFRCLDTANWDEMAGLFHPDVEVHFIGGSYEWTLSGRDEYLGAVQQAFHAGSVGHHNGHQPEIQILGDDEATGLWYLADHMWILEHRFQTSGTALYWDRYRKYGGRWTIRETRYRRIYEVNQQLAENPPFSAHYLAARAKAETPG